MAERSIKQAKIEKNWIETAYFLALNKQIDSKKEKALLHLFEEAKMDFEKNPKKSLALVGKSKTKNLAAFAVVCNAMINLDEFVVKE